MYKTVQCRNWNTPQGCPFGDKCTFLHPGDRLQKPPKQNVAPASGPVNPKSKLCRDWNTPQGCSRGVHCKYFHPNSKKGQVVPSVSGNIASRTGRTDGYHHQENQTQTFTLVETEEKEIDIHGASIGVGIGGGAGNATFTVVCDTSGSMNMHDKITATIDGVRDVYQVMDNNDKLAVVAFDNKVETLLGLKKKFRVEFERLSTDVRSRTASGGSTALYDAIIHAIETTPHDTKYNDWAREMVVITDGEDNASKSSIDQVAAKLAKPGIHNFHFVLVGVGLSSQTEQLLKQKLCSFGHTQYISCGGTGSALRDVFAKQVKVGFVQRVQKLRERITKTKTITVQNSQEVKGRGNNAQYLKHGALQQQSQHVISALLQQTQPPTRSIQHKIKAK